MKGTLLVLAFVAMFQAAQVTVLSELTSQQWSRAVDAGADLYKSYHQARITDR